MSPIVSAVQSTPVCWDTVRDGKAGKVLFRKCSPNEMLRGMPKRQRKLAGGFSRKWWYKPESRQRVVRRMRGTGH